ncbi:regulator of G protein signaling superfamily [Durotheca rogersii]|uniref:regulator of G protein signaling superfamily n=1 Tax=Durotheca rogersii TaxID=419775 RepID=UPI00221EF82C|nr:regulator of G protein signaling superfamily [Durotheca rogersii]KAI5864144.1 regulator of G protein signaling superfamily [Durotheca rogersii]
MGISRLRGSSPVYLNPSPRELSPPSSILGDWDQATAMDTSRPTSLAAIPRTSSPFANPPTLSEILANTAPPPWTLSSFMAFLSQNHCLETLEFILDAERYGATYYQIAHGRLSDGPEHICSLWRKVIDAYIMPCAPREVNLPAHVRDRLLQLSCCKSNPPHPSELDEAIQIVRELINDSILVPFLESVVPATISSQEEALDLRQGRSRLRTPRDPITSDEASQSPRAPYLPLFMMGRGSGTSHYSTSASMEMVDGDLITDDSSSPNSTSGAEPMTPPTTPPMSDFSYHTSPNALQKAVSGNSWKKMGAKLGLTRKNKSSRRTGSTPMQSEPSPRSTAGQASYPPPL